LTLTLSSLEKPHRKTTPKHNLKNQKKPKPKTKKAGDRLTVALARTIHLDGTAETGRHDAASPLVTRASSLMDGYEYVMHGRVFKYAGAGGTTGRARVEMIASFGGLLLKLGGEAAKLQLLEVDSAVYLLVRKL
jgi:DNA-directed RNA polymerases I, II, and III subunit RPABC3